jgi:hypothetical protein
MSKSQRVSKNGGDAPFKKQKIQEESDYRKERKRRKGARMQRNPGLLPELPVDHLNVL